MRFIFAILCLAGAGLNTVTPARGGTVDWIQAVVGDAIITGWQVIEPTLDPKFKASLLQNFPDQTESFYQAKVAAIREETLKQMVDYQLVLQDFKRLEKGDTHAKIPDIWVEDRIRERIRDPLFGGDRAAFIKSLQARGMTMEEYHAQVRDEIIVQAMKSQFLTEPLISPHKLEAYYREHQDKYKMEERVRFQRLFIKKNTDPGKPDARKLAENIIQNIKDGASFAEMAKTYSDDSRPDNGDWRELSSLGQAFRDEIKKLKPGECSGVVETTDGCFLLLVVERDPEHLAPLGEVRDQVERELTEQENTRRLETWMKRLRAKTYFEENAGY